MAGDLFEYAAEEPFSSALAEAYTSDDELLRRIGIVQQAARDLGPKEVMALATSPVDDDGLMRMVSRTSAYAQSSAQATFLASMPPDHQEKRWAAMTRAQQENLRAAGYVPPGQIRTPAPSWMRRAAEGVGGVLDTVTQPLQDSVGALLKGAETIGRQASHAFRAVQYAVPNMGDPSQTQGGFAEGAPGTVGLGVRLANMSADEFGAAADPRVMSVRKRTANLLDAWTLTGDGEQTFKPTAIRRAFDALGDDDPELMQVLMRVASGDPLEEVAGEYATPGTPEYEQTYLSLAQTLEDGRAKKALAALGAGHVSPGRMLADPFTTPGTTSYALLSGAGDAFFQWYTDPLLAAGKARKTYLAARYAINGRTAQQLFNRIDHVWDHSDRVRRAGDEIAEAVKTGDFAMLGQKLPRSQRVITGLIAYDNALRAKGLQGIQTGEDVKAFYKSQAGLVALAKGQWKGATSDDFRLPMLSRTGQAAARAKVAMEEAVNFITDAGLALREPFGSTDLLAPGLVNLGSSAGVRDQLAKATIVSLSPATAFAEGFLTKIPRQGYLPLNSPDTPEVLQQLLSFGIRGQQRRDFINQFLAADIADKRVIARNALNVIFQRAGVFNVPETAQWADQFLNSLDNQRYAAGELDLLVDGKRAGVLPRAHRADAIALPDFRELIAQTRRLNATRFIFGAVNNRAVDTFMGSFWKPAVLLRLGFIPRAAGEEMLAYIVRYSPAKLAKAYAAAIGGRDGDTLGMLRPATWAAEHLAHFVPDAVLAGGTKEDFWAHHLANRASGVVRRSARSWAGPEMVEAMRDLVGHSTISRAFIERVGGRNGIIGEVVDDATDGPAPLMARVKFGPDRVVELPMKPDGTFGEMAKGSESYLINFDKRIREHVNDPVGRRAAQAMAVHVPEGQADEIRHAFEDVDWVRKERFRTVEVNADDPNRLAAVFRDEPTGEFDILPGHDIVAEIRHRLALAPIGIQRQVREFALSGDEKALAKAAKHPAVAADPVLAALVAKLPALTKRNRHALTVDLGHLFEDIDDSAAYALNPGGWFHGTVYGMDGKLVEDFDTLTPLGAVGPGYYLSEYGRYSDIYADPANIRGAAKSSSAQPAVFRFRWTGDKPMKLLRPEQAPDEAVTAVAKGLGRFLSGDDLTEVRGRIVELAQRGEDGWIFSANARALKAWTEARPGMDPQAVRESFNRAWRENVIARLEKLGYHGIYDRSVQGASQGIHNAISLFDARLMEKVGTVNVAERQAMDLATTDRLAERRRLVERALRDPEAARALTADMARVRASGMDMADDVASWERAQQGVSHPLPQGMVRVFMPALPAGDAKALLARLHTLPEPGALSGEMNVGANFVAAANQVGGQGFTANQVVRSVLHPDDPFGAVMARRAEDIADAGLTPLGRWGSTDPEQARAMVDKLRDQIGADFSPAWGLTFVDVPVDEAMRLRARPFVTGSGRDDLDSLPDKAVDPMTDFAQGDLAEATRTGGRPRFDERVGTQVWLPEHYAGSAIPLDEAAGVVPVANLTDADREALAVLLEARSPRITAALQPRNDEELMAAAAQVWDDLVAADSRYGALPFLNDELRARRIEILREVAPSDTLRGLLDSIERAGDDFWSQLGARVDPEGTVLEGLGRVNGIRSDERMSVPALLDRLADKHKVDPLSADQLESLPRWARAVIEDRALVRPGALSLAPGRDPGEVLAEATKTSADNAWQIFASDDGRPLHEILGPVSEGRYSYDEHLLGAEALDDLPSTMSGPNYVAHHERWDQALIRWGFDDVIGRSITALIRQPLFLGNYAKAKGFAKTIEPVLRDEELYGQALTTLGTQDRMHAVAEAFRSMDDGLRKRLVNVHQPGTVGEWAAVEEIADSIPEALHDLDLADINMLSRWANNHTHVQATVRDIALERAITDSVPFIDDHKIRSQFQVYARNFIPFWFAEEQFLARWARTFVHSPEALRKAQLYMNGLRATGRTTENEYGEEVYLIPGSEAVVDVMARVGSYVFGKDSYVPELKGAFALQGQVGTTLPGLGGEMGRPQFGPLAGVFVGTLSRRFPELGGLDDAVLGDRGANRSIPEQLIPTSLMRAFRWLSSHPDEYAAMTIQAIQYLEANGYSPPDEATSDELEDWLMRVENHTRTLLAAQTVIGFASPASPQADIDGAELSGEFKELLRNLPLEEAVGEFLARHPDATPHTIFSTESASGAPLASTPESLAFMDANPEIFAEYPLAAAWLLPQSQSKDNFERRAYHQQLAWGLRRRKAPNEVLRDIRFAKAADDYFTLKEEVEDALARPGMPTAEKKQIREWWRAEKAAYMKQHPVFAEELQKPEAHLRRMRVLAELPRVLNDPRVPKDDQYEAMRAMVEGWYTHQAELAPLMDDQRAVATRQRKAMRESFATWARAFADENPSVKAFYQRVLAPEIGVDVEDLDG